MSRSVSLRLKTGVHPQIVVDRLLELQVAGRNVASGSRTAEEARVSYLQWVEEVEQHLAWASRDRGLLQLPLSPRYWAIQQLDLATATRPLPLITAEINSICETLAELADGLARHARAMGSEPGAIAVVDTNVLLHYTLISNVDWSAVLETSPPVRVLIPLRVIEELDAHKWGMRPDLRKRARKVLGQLDALCANTTRAGLGNETTLELSAAFAGPTRWADADADILDACHEIQQFVGRPVTVVSGDRGMHLRAAGEGLASAEMPEKYLNRSDD